MKKNLQLIALLLFSTASVFSQCVTNVNFNTWVPAGAPPPTGGVWTPQNGGSEVFQSENTSGPAFFLSPFNLMNVHVSGEFRTTDSDDDWMGFVFSYRNPLAATDTFDCWLFDWKEEAQEGASSGMSVCRANGVIPPSQYHTTFWEHLNTTEFTTVLNNFGSAGWDRFNYHQFDLYLTYTSLEIYVDGALKFTHSDCFRPGRFGFYNYSQDNCTYRNFQYDLFVDFAFASDKVCVNDVAQLQFVSPCVTDAITEYQSVTWNFGDGSPPLVVNNPTIADINATHVYTQPGTYNVTLTAVDVYGCSATKSNPLEVRTNITATPSGVPPLCNGASTGSVSVAATGGYGNYTYSWNGGTNISQTYSGVGAGTYSVLVSDGICDAASATVTLNQPTAVSATTSHTDASCGQNNGSVSMVISGGTPPYQGMSWAGFPGATVNNLPAGLYIADFRDANGCSALLQYQETINALPCGINSNTTKTNVTCFGGNNGTATLNVTGSTGTPNVIWTPGNATTFTVSNLAAGTYTYSYTDADPGHAFTGTVTITQPGAAMSASIATIGISCAGSSDGQAIASVNSGGNPAYSYVWSGGQPNAPTVSNLAPGPISVVVTDAIGCTAAASGTISGSPTLTTTVTTVMDSCFHSSKGSATIQASGGTPPYTYYWNNFDTDTINENIFAGNYQVTVTDDKGCTVTASATVPGPSSGLINVYSQQNVLCAGAATGSISITSSGGTPPYTYTWNPNTVSGNNPTNLVAGLYEYTTTDSYGCSVIGNDTILEPATPLTVTSSNTDITCSGAADGSITITISGGTAPYTYLTNTIPDTGTFTQNNVPSGIYTGTISDANGCSVTISDTITEPAPQSLSLTATDATCSGYADGTATANFVNATGTVTYNWNPGGVQSGIRTALPAGTYSVTATDANTCTVSGSVAINEPSGMQVQETHNNVSCFGFTDGDMTLTVTNGVPNYTYVWSPNVSSSNTATGLGSGVYNITITDQTPCSVTFSAVVTQPFQAVADSVVAQDVSCFGLTDGRITVFTTGGTGTYTYTWNPNVSSTNNALNLAAGTYDITVADVNNCSLTESIIITEPAAPLALTQSQVDLTCFGDSSGSATVNVAGGTTPYTYNWTPNAGNTSTVSTLTEGTYSVVVTDDHLCTVTASFTLTQPQQLTATNTVSNILCYGDATGQVAVTTNGGLAPYGYAWSQGVSTTDTARNLLAGTYTYTVTDNSNCTFTQSATVTQPDELILNVSVTNVTCNNADNGTLTATGTNGTQPYSYAITNDGINFQNSNSGQYTALMPGNYVVLLTDANGCTDSGSVTITEAAALAISTTAVDVLCYGDDNGQLSISISNGVQPLTYTLSSGDQNSTGLFTNLSADSYTITVTDANNCTITDMADIIEPDSLTVSITPDSIEINLGQVVVLQSSNNQLGSVTYNWQPAAGLSCNDCDAPEFNGYTSLNYTLLVTNADGCTGTANARVTVKPSYDIFIPNGFSPNGDGANDYWMMYGNMQGIKQMSIMVYNRTGEKVFEANDINFTWDGKYKGVNSPPGVYVYVAKFVWLNNFTDTERTGALTILK